MMLDIWKKTKTFVAKYWQLLLAAGAVAIVLVKYGFTVAQHKDVLENEVETSKKIAEIKHTFDAKIEKAEAEAELAHDEKVIEIKKKEIEELKLAKNEAVVREKDNNTVSNDELAKRFGNTFGAEVVKKDDE
jgi:hypothetical protein